jgi:hypothetical protein
MVQIRRRLWPIVGLVLLLSIVRPARAGNYYTNVTVKDATQAQVVAAIKKLGKTAYVSPAYQGCVVVYEKASDDQDIGLLTSLAAALSSTLERPTVAVVVHADDQLMLWVYNKGERLDEYNSWPGYFDWPKKVRKPSGGKSTEICAVLGAKGAEMEVEKILRKTNYVFETERHEQLVRALKLPEAAAGTGYRYLEQGETPEDFKQYVKVQ